MTLVFVFVLVLATCIKLLFTYFIMYVYLLEHTQAEHGSTLSLGTNLIDRGTVIVLLKHDLHKETIKTK